jgi:F420-non-reducing hydrogenase iron-sulfur subunit
MDHKTKIDETKNQKVEGIFEPKIVGFLCNWCAYSGADLAGVSRLKSSPNIRIIRTMCSGRVDPSFIMRAFQLGADGVLIAGCHFGDCHYVEGNFKTLRRVEMMKLILKQFGISENRLRLEWISASEAEKYAKVSFEFTEQIRELGPLKFLTN